MAYNLQIQKLLLKIKAIADPKDQLILIKQAISLADTHNDIEWAFELRLKLINIESDMSKRENSLPAFTWILDAYDRNPDLFKERSFLWKYKWMISYVRRTATVSMEQIEAITEDFKTRMLRNGYSLRPYYQAKAHMALFMNDLLKVREYLELADKELRDNMSNCAACELDDKVELELLEGNFDTALALGQDLFSKKLTCAHMPFTTYCTCVHIFTNAKDFERAHEFYLKAEEDLMAMKNDTSQIINVSSLIYYLTASGNQEKAWEYFERYNDWSHESDDYRSYAFAKNVLPLLKNGGQRSLQINPVMPWYREDSIYNISELYDYYYNIAFTLAQQFDARHGNNYFMEKLTKILEA